MPKQRTGLEALGQLIQMRQMMEQPQAQQQQLAIALARMQQGQQESQLNRQMQMENMAAERLWREQQAGESRRQFDVLRGESAERLREQQDQGDRAEAFQRKQAFQSQQNREAGRRASVNQAEQDRFAKYQEGRRDAAIRRDEKNEMKAVALQQLYGPMINRMVENQSLPADTGMELIGELAESGDVTKINAALTQIKGRQDEQAKETMKPAVTNVLAKEIQQGKPLSDNVVQAALQTELQNLGLPAVYLPVAKKLLEDARMVLAKRQPESPKEPEFEEFTDTDGTIYRATDSALNRLRELRKQRGYSNKELLWFLKQADKQADKRTAEKQLREQKNKELELDEWGLTKNDRESLGIPHPKK